MPLLRMWWHWHNHLHRYEFKENVSQLAQQESSYILNTSTGDETAGHVLYKSSSLTGDCAAVVGSVYRADERVWTGTHNIAFPLFFFFFYLFEGGLPVMRHLAEAKMHQMKGCLASCVNAKVLRSIFVKITWLQSGAHAELRRGVGANPIWVFGCCSC